MGWGSRIEETEDENEGKEDMAKPVHQMSHGESVTVTECCGKRYSVVLRRKVRY